MGYTQQALRGFGWMGGFRVASRGVAFVRTAILARLLTPAQFGVYGIGIIALALLEMLTETGINVFLIQEKEDIHKYLGTARTVSVFRGILISLLIFLSAPFIEKFFAMEGAKNILWLISLVPLIRGFINPSLIRFQKELSFRKEFFYRMSSFSLDSTVAVIVALSTKSTLSMVWGLLAGAVLEVIITNLFIKPTPSFEFHLPRFKEVTGRGKWVTLAGVFDYLSKQGDNLVVGKVLGAAPLGLYQNAYALSTLPVTEVSDVAGKVTFPVYSIIGGDVARAKKAYLKTLGVVSVLAIPIFLILFFFPSLIINIALGEQWLGAVDTLRILAVFGLIKAISQTSSALFLGIRKQELVTLFTFVRFFVLAITIYPLTVSYGIVGAAYSAIASALAVLPFMAYFLIKVLSK